MSTATAVPPTAGLEGDEAFETLRSTGRRKLAMDAFDRFRAADGFSHSRALGFQVALTLVPSLIAVIGAATYLDWEVFTRVVREVLDVVAPGASYDLLTQALSEGERNAREERGEAAVAIGGFAALVAGTTALGQLERGANRIYGVERDRPPLRKYGTALLLFCTAGVSGLLALVVLVAGHALKRAFRWEGGFDAVWDLLRWPLGVLLAVIMLALLFHVVPRRRQPEPTWLMVGSGVTAVLWLTFTGVLAFFLDQSKQFGATYGPLAGMIGVLLWAFLSSLAILLGLAFAAQLEAVRAGVKETRVQHDSWT